ncbi:MAG: N-acetylmuramoyl-L-alanine amidase [bacterium]|nr:N-acetylmuramoyl-L-alanine amidase [bacterium]
MHESRSPVRPLYTFAIVLAGLASACAGRPQERPQSHPTAGESAGIEARAPRARPASSTTAGGLPPWVGASQGWEKLNSIEAWLRTEAPFADVFWVVEGHLQLAEGRLQLARNGESQAQGTRTRTSRAGFERVLASNDASEGQRQRARRGLARLGQPTQTRPAATAPSGVLPRSAWGARQASPRRMDRTDGVWRYITVHHSAMEGEGRLSGDLAESHSAIRRIQSAHMSGEGYGDIGYHFLVDPAGRIFQGRDMRYQGAHAGGNNNVGNVGICLLGNFDRTRPTRQALAALDGLVAFLSERHSIQSRRIKGHRDWKNTQCPGRYLAAHVERYH